MKKVEKNILIFFNTILDIKNTKEKIEKYKKINDLKIYLYLKEKDKIKNKDQISIEILKEIFKRTKIIRREKEIYKLIK